MTLRKVVAIGFYTSIPINSRVLGESMNGTLKLALKRKDADLEI
jgi:hypothetical protein